MPEQIASTWAAVAAKLKQLSLGAKIGSVMGAIALIFGMVVFATWVSKPVLTPLYTGLSAQDASAIVEEVSAAGVAYELADGGSTVLVPQSAVYDLRLKVASSGVSPSGGGGYQLLDTMGMTSSEFQQNVTYKRALEGELAKTITAIEGIEVATVQLAIPEKTVFVEQVKAPTASVFIQTRQGAQLSDDQIQSITNLVSASIEGMKSTDVAVTDATGKVLSAIGAAPQGSSNKQTQEHEQRVAAAVQGTLDRVLGPGNAVVTVTADMNFNAVERTTEKFESNKDTKPLQEKTSTEEYTGAGNNSTGVLGPDNIAVPNGTQQGSGEYNNETEERTNAVDKTTERTVEAVGTLSRQSVSVAIDQGASAAMNLDDLTSMVTVAAGIDTDRGDAISVVQVPFDRSTANDAAKALADARKAEKDAQREALIFNGAVAGGIALFLIALLVILRRRKPIVAEVQEPEPFLPPLAVPVLDAELERKLEDLKIDDLSDVDAPAEDVREAESQLAELESLTEDSPEKIAKVFQAVLNSGEQR